MTDITSEDIERYEILTNTLTSPVDIVTTIDDKSGDISKCSVD